jgi:hypothetical protein
LTVTASSHSVGFALLDLGHLRSKWTALGACHLGRRLLWRRRDAIPRACRGT